MIRQCWFQVIKSSLVFALTDESLDLCHNHWIKTYLHSTMRTTNQRQSRSRDLSQFDDPICAPQAKIYSENASETSISFQKCVRNSKKFFAPIGAKCILKSRNKILKSRENDKNLLSPEMRPDTPPPQGGGSIFYKISRNFQMFQLFWGKVALCFCPKPEIWKLIPKTTFFRDPILRHISCSNNDWVWMLCNGFYK